MGIVYTPQAIVDFMCASVEEVLKTQFGKTLASEDVYLIDPCTGTGNFIVNLIRRIPKAKLEDVYKHRLFANERSCCCRTTSRHSTSVYARTTSDRQIREFRRAVLCRHT